MKGRKRCFLLGKTFLNFRKTILPENGRPNGTEVYRQEVCHVFQNSSSKGQLRFCFDVRKKKPKCVETKFKEKLTQEKDQIGLH